jgi:hypothetical protein
MSAAAASSPAPKAGSFASLLATFSAPLKSPDNTWNLDGLEEDVATITYEQALKAHSRTRIPPSTAQTDTERPLPPGSVRITEWSAEPQSFEANAPRNDQARGAVPRERRKSASVTIRLTHAESTQLHQRATEAGLTISAYLRSCVLEAETLRAQVKEALAQLRQDPAAGDKKPVQSDPTAVAVPRSRFLPNWHWIKRPPAA